MEFTEDRSETAALLVGIVVLTVVSVSANVGGLPFWQRSVLAVALGLLAAIATDHLLSTYLGVDEAEADGPETR